MSNSMTDRQQGVSPEGIPAFGNHLLRAMSAGLALCAAASLVVARADDTDGPAPAPAFTPSDDGGYAFDTGVLEGRLNAGGRALGLTGVVHKPTGRPLAGGLGLMHPYRIFSGSRRFGDGARDWKTASRVLDDGAVEVRWEPPFDVPFELRAVYRWHNATTLDVLIGVRAVDELPAFEVFLASYFDAGFAEPFVYVEDPDDGPALLLGERALGHWLMAPRDDAAVAMIQDGRWRAQPHPVDWTLLPPLAGPVAVRRDRHSDLVAVVMAPEADCFAVSTPYAGEGHYSLYLSLLGCDIAAGGQAGARARLMIGTGLTDADIADHYRRYTQ